MVLVDIRETKSVKASDIFLQVRPGKDFELITLLRAMIKDQPVNGTTGRRDWNLAGTIARFRRPHESRQIRVLFLRHGIVDDSRETHEFGRPVDVGC